MASHDFGPDDSAPRGTSRRGLLRAFAAAPVVTAATPWREALASLHQYHSDEPATLERTKEGRSLSRFRYHSAERSFMIIEAGFFSDPRLVRDTLHQAGAIAKLALCGYLLDVGFPDAWLAVHIRQDITKALAYANATGFAHDCPEMARLAVVLTPYWKWGYHPMHDNPPLSDGGFTPDWIQSLLRGLLDRVHDATGHPYPKGARGQRQEGRS